MTSLQVTINLLYLIDHMETVRAVLELAYFVSGIVVAGAALVGLKQLHLLRESLEVAKQDYVTRNRREAAGLAIEQSSRYADAIMKILHLANDLVLSKGLPWTPWPLDAMEFTPESVRLTGEAGRWVQAVLSDDAVRVAATNAVNALESFALYFMSGAADEKIAYPAIAPSYCSAMDCLAPLLIALRAGQIENVASGGFENSVALYRIWATRAEEQRLEEARKRLPNVVTPKIIGE